MEAINAAEWESLGAAYAALEGEPLSPDGVQGWLQRWSDLDAQLYEAMGNAASRSHGNTADAEAEALHLHFVRNIAPKAEVAREALKRKLLAVEGYEPPADQRRMMDDFRLEQRLFRAENVPLQTEANVLSSDYRKRVGGMAVGWEGDALTLEQAEARLNERDRAKRAAIWRALMASWQAERGGLNMLFLDMLALRRQIAANAGFPTYLEYAWLDRGRTDYTPDDARRFQEAIEQEVVPVARRLYEQRRAALGVATLRPWDLDVEPRDLPPLRPFASGAELEEGCARIFHAVDPTLGAQFEALRDGFLDLESRPNKAPGGYCRGLPVSQRSFIFMNAVGKHRNVQTLLHEGGHAFHNQATFALPLLWQRHPGAEMAEVASMAMEMLAQPYLERGKGGFYDEADARRARAEHLRKIVLFLPYMAVVDAFQGWVYRDAPAAVTADHLDATWAALWDRFMVGIDYAGLDAERETGWHRKLHIFLYPLYYIEYGLAQVGALQVWRNAQQDQAGALAAYRHALALGATRPLPELYQAAGARLAFDAATLRELMAEVEEELARLG